jgi:hypothetical protein
MEEFITIVDDYFSDGGGKRVLMDAIVKALALRLENDDEETMTLDRLGKIQTDLMTHFNIVFDTDLKDTDFVARSFATMWSERNAMSDMADESEKQSFSFYDILDYTSKLFGFVLTPMRRFYMMHVLRNFNTLFTGMRNLKSLFSNWIDFLPEFIRYYCAESWKSMVIGTIGGSRFACY